MKLFKPTQILLLMAACASLVWSAGAENPKQIRPAGYVTDLAGVVASETKTRLENLCSEVEQKTGAQIAVATVHSLEGESIENYSVDLYKQFGVGQKADNRGVLLLVAPEEHRYRVEVGYGLEPVINDARAGDAGRAMVPFLRQGDYGAAIETSAWQLAKYIADDSNVTLSGQPPVRRFSHRSNGGGISIFWVIAGLIFLFSFLGRASGGRLGGGGSGLLWFLLGMMANSGRRSGSNWGGGGFGGGSGGWGGGGGFGGFGGGSSGGGGASGSW